MKLGDVRRTGKTVYEHMRDVLVMAEKNERALCTWAHLFSFQTPEDLNCYWSHVVATLTIAEVIENKSQIFHK